MRVKSDTIIRTILLAIALINQVLTSIGKNPLPFSDETVYEFLTLAFTLATTVWSWWKNNSFTHEAILADQVMYDFKTDNFIILDANDEDDDTDDAEG